MAKHKTQMEQNEDDNTEQVVVVEDTKRELVKETRVKERVRAKASVNYLMREAAIGGVSREEVCERAFKACIDDDYTHNAQGREISKEGLLRLLNAIVRDIRNKRKGWWQVCDYEETFEDASDPRKVVVFKVYGYNR